MCVPGYSLGTYESALLPALLLECGVTGATLRGQCLGLRSQVGSQNGLLVERRDQEYGLEAVLVVPGVWEYRRS